MKKFGKIIICLCLGCTFLFTGCGLVQRNTARYLNRTVASVGNEITVSKQELLTAYNSTGYQYVQNYGMTVEDAVKTTIDGLINRKIILAEAKKVIKLMPDENDGNKEKYFFVNYGDDADGDGEKDILSKRPIAFKNTWENEIKKNAYDSINSSLASIEEQVRKELNIDEPAEEETEEKESDYPTENVYEKKVKFENGVWTAEEFEMQDDEEPIGDFIQNETGNAVVSQRAYDRFIKQLMLSEKGKGLSTVESEVFQRELDRIIDIFEEDKYIKAFEEQFNYNQSIDEGFNKKIVNYYKNMVLSSHEKYALLGDKGYEKYCEDMQSSSGTVYYHPYGAKFVQVSHILIKLSETQLAEIGALNTELETGVITQKERDMRYQNIINSTVVHERDKDGNETETTKTVKEVYDEVNAELNKYSTVEEKAVAFNKFIYKYNQDEGIMNAENYYVVNLDTNIQDKMVKPFADKSRELASQKAEGGNLGEAVFVESENYSGYHIIFNAGVLSNENELSIEQIKNLDESYAETLYEKKIMLGTDKTYYDFIYDKLVASNYSNYTLGLTRSYKHNLTVTYYVGAYKDMF